jgi:hypothetical protein
MPLMFNPRYARQLDTTEDIKRTFNGLEISEGKAPANKFLVDPRVSKKFKYQFNVQQDEWVCIPKGLIVATATNADYNSSGVAGDIRVNAANSGEGHYFKEFESGKYYHGLTIANGGIDVANEVDQRMVDRGVPTAKYTRTANVPLGVIMKNIYYKVDDRMIGGNGNSGTVLADAFIEVPYVPDRVLAGAVQWGCATGGDGLAGDPGYLRPGDYVKSDANGHFVKWNPGTLTNIPYITGTSIFTAGTAASGTLNVADDSTGMNANDTVVIGTVTLTAIAADATPAADTATTGEFKIGANANETAANLLAKINAHATLHALVTATQGTAADIVKVTANVKGRAGNSIVLTGNARCVVGDSATTLTGGVDPGYSSNQSAGATAALYIGADDPAQIVGQVWDVTGQLQPEGWLQWVMWSLDMVDEDLVKLLGIKAEDLQLSGWEYGYPWLDKYLNMWRYQRDKGRGIEGLTDGSNILTKVEGQVLYPVIPAGATQGQKYFFNVPREAIVEGSVLIEAFDHEGTSMGTAARIGQPIIQDTLVFDRFQKGDGEYLVSVVYIGSTTSTEPITLKITYDAYGMVPGVPTLWDVNGSVGAVRIRLGGLGK